jgi:hypothetical protein
MHSMSEQHHTRESIVQTLQNVAGNLGKKILSGSDVKAHLSLSVINYHFGSLGNALAVAGLAGNKPGPTDAMLTKRFTENDLFISVLEVEQKIGHEPGWLEYRANGGNHSYAPFTQRFGKWSETLQHYRKWKAERRGAPTVPDKPCDNSDAANGAVEHALVPAGQLQRAASSRPLKATQFFGAPIDFRGLRHAPINEQGVVYLFGMVSRELGFSVESLQQGFPDCEGKYLHDKSRNLWAKARIEFEFRASNFRLHGHDENECDVIVCWENDWPDCPLRVVELKSEIMRLSSR